MQFVSNSQFLAFTIKTQLGESSNPLLPRAHWMETEVALKDHINFKLSCVFPLCVPIVFFFSWFVSWKLLT
jgi:hypothetical protein